MIETKKLAYSIKEKEILKNITLKTKKGDFVSIIGPNGAGKSTFLKILRRLLNLNMGKIYLDDEDILKFDNKKLSKLISYLPQTIKAVSCSVEDCILLGRKPHIKIFPSKIDYKKCEDMISNLNLENLKDKNMLNLSGGELQKVLIARSLVQESKILFLDEPINHLDVKNQLEILSGIFNC